MSDVACPREVCTFVCVVGGLVIAAVIMLLSGAFSVDLSDQICQLQVDLKVCVFLRSCGPRALAPRQNGGELRVPQVRCSHR